MKTNLKQGIVLCFFAALLCCQSKAQTPTPPQPRIMTPPQQPLEIITPPKGVPATAWVEISDKLGFVITKDAPKQRRLIPDGSITAAQGSPPVVTGYFVILRDGRWVRMETELPPARLFPAR
jgi:hypothetical protein